jgi:hypothetical protein
MTYGSKLRARLDLAGQKQFGQVGRAFPESFFEEVFQRKVTGGFDVKKHGKCGQCFQVRSANGKCGCDY